MRSLPSKIVFADCHNSHLWNLSEGHLAYLDQLVLRD